MEFDEGSKRLSIERIYQKKTQLEHILLRPDTYIGSVEDVAQSMWVYDELQDAIVQRQIKFVPGLYKIFDEILVNAADNKQRDLKMNAIKVVINREKNLISVWNNGRGIPVEVHKKEGMYVPSMIFGHLLTSSNFDDKQKKVTGGRNGYGAKLCNIFSTLFTVETANSQSKKAFKQTWKKNMSGTEEPQIKDSKDDYTKVTFCPDLPKFGMESLDDDTVALMTRRIYDLAGCLHGVKVYLNDKRIPISNFKQYVELYLKVHEDDENDPEGHKVVYDKVGSRWEVCVTVSHNGFQQASFVNSIATTKGGKHLDHVVDQMVSKIADAVKKKNKGGMELKPHQIRSHLWVFVNCQIENPAFDSQTKENMTLKQSAFGSKCEFGDKFLKDVLKCGVVESCVAWAQAKSKVQLNKLKKTGPKNSKLRGIAKLDDANNAGGKFAKDCTLIVTEGDSAKTIAVSGLSIVGRDNYGVFPLRGKLLNVRDASHKQLMNNEEIMNLVKIMGLEFGKKYPDDASRKSLRYGHLMIMADQDQDGSHIKGLVINFIHTNWPSLIRVNFVHEFITPIVKVTKAGKEVPFFSLPEFEHWQATTDNHHTWKVKYYKGLGTSTSKEAKEYFSDMDRHCIRFKYAGDQDDQSILLAFAKDKVEQRKEWLTDWLGRRKEKRQQGLSDSYLYGERVEYVSYSEFINKELILFSNADNERSIPCLVDGLKPGQRKVLFTCLKRNDKRDVKVAQLAGSVAELSAYHHGEASLMSTIINLAQNFVGSNNINLLQPIGQFGTRLAGGKDAASARYIFTLLSPLAKKMFNPTDDHGLNFLTDDNIKIEPEWYCPIVPLVLINGCEGIGTGYSTTVPNHDPREVVENLKRMMNGLEPQPMSPKYKQFTGTIAHVMPTKYAVYGNVSRLSSTSLEITELPVRRWTQDYKEAVLEVMLHGSDKVEPFITDYKEYHTDTTVKFVVTLSEQRMEEAAAMGFHKKFKLEGSLSINNMVLFDENGCLRRYSDSAHILKEFYELRLVRYRTRKDWLEGKLQAEANKITQQARFVLEMYNGTMVFQKKSKADMVAILKQRKYTGDPVAVWKARVSSAQAVHEEDEEEDGRPVQDDKSSQFNYLLGMPMWNMSLEKKNELLQEKEKKLQELELVKSKTPKDLWNDDLDEFLQTLQDVESEEQQLQAVSSKIKVKSKAKGQQRQSKLTTHKAQSEETKPSAFSETIDPQIPTFSVPIEKKPKVPKSSGAVTAVKTEMGPKQKKLDFVVKKKETVSAFSDGEDSGEMMQTSDPSPKDKPAPSIVLRKRSRKTVNIDSDEDSNDDSEISFSPDEEFAVGTSKSKKADKPPARKKVVDDDFEIGVSSDDEFAVGTSKSKKADKPPASKKAMDDDFEISVSSDEEFAVKTSKSKKPSRPPAKKKDVKKAIDDDSEVNFSDEEFAVKTSKSKKPSRPPAKRKDVKKAAPKPAKKTSPVKPSKSAEVCLLTDSDEDEPVAVKKPMDKKQLPAPKTSKEVSKEKKTAVVEDDDDEEEDEDAVPLAQRITRKRNVQAKYFNDSEEASDNSNGSAWGMSD